MLHKKITPKESNIIGKKDIKHIRTDVNSVIGDENAVLCDELWTKKCVVEKRRWQIAQGSSVVLYLINNVPLFLSVDGLPADSEGLFTARKKGIVIPTLFFLLKARVLAFRDSSFKEMLPAMVSKIGVSVLCRGPTSRFLISGAHLMMPGIVACDRSSVPDGTLALVYSIGCTEPYAIGLTTKHFSSNDASGIGVYILHCFGDLLWRDFVELFIASCTSLCKDIDCIPNSFSKDEVLESLENWNNAACNTDDVIADTVEATGDQEPVECPPEKEEEKENDDNEDAVESPPVFNTLFPDTESLLQFSYCEAVKKVSPSMLPMPVTQFTVIFNDSYPRLTSQSGPIEWKDTVYKKAMPFFQSKEDVMQIEEPVKGVHSVTKVHKSAPMMREHNLKYSAFLEEVQQPALEQEAADAQAKLLEDTKLVFSQKIASCQSLYKPRKHMDEVIAAVLLGGSTTAGIEKEYYPTLDEAAAGVMAPTTEEEGEASLPFDDELRSQLFHRKEITDNLRQYIKINKLLIATEKGCPPTVKSVGIISLLLTRGATDPSIVEAEELALRQFTVVNEIVIQTSVNGSTIVTESIPPVRLVKNGALPQVSIWTEKRRGNKDIVIIKNLEAFGFNMNNLCKLWRQRFSTSCTVVDPSVGMTNLKSGTKIPREIHLQGKMLTQIENVLTKELSIPMGCVVSGKR